MKQEDHLHLALSRYSISRKATLNVCIVCMCVWGGHVSMCIGMPVCAFTSVSEVCNSVCSK